MENILLGTDKNILKRVYSRVINERVLDGLSYDSIYDKNDIINSPQQFQNVKHIFSTWNMPQFNNQEISSCFPNLKAVFYAAGMYRYFAIPFVESGVRVFSASITNSQPVAEFVVAQIILANKGYYQSLRSYRKPLWKYSYLTSRKFVVNRKGNYFSRVGIIGLGNIGLQVSKLLKGYDLEVCFYDPYVPDHVINELRIKRIELDELFSTCDVITNHLPDIDSTKDLINYNLLSKMKPYSTFINTGRGAQVVEKDLVKALKKDKTRCAILDVLKREPFLPWSSLYLQSNAFITPHIAGSTGEEEYRLADSMIKAYFDYLSGNNNTCEVTDSLIER